MYLRPTHSLLAIGLLSTMAVSAAHADDIVLDAFTDQFPDMVFPNNNPGNHLWTGHWNGAVHTSDPAPQPSGLLGVLGGGRYALMVNSSPDHNFISIQNGKLKVTTEGRSGTFQLNYGAYASLELDVSGCSTLRFALDGDLDGTYPRPVDLVTTMVDGHGSSHQFTKMLQNDGLYDIDLAQFASIDTSDVSTIELFFDASAVQSVDFMVTALTFTGCPAPPSGNYDHHDEALELTDLNACRSDDQAFSNEEATGDGNTPSCYSNGPTSNVWFKFTALTEYIDVRLYTGGTAGTLQYPVLALWDASNNELGCTRINYEAYPELSLQKNNLVPGGTYYISVDAFNQASYQGTFSLFINDIEPTTNDNQWSAYRLWTSVTYTDGLSFSTLNATPDGGPSKKGSCWTNGPNYNRWFKFRAGTSTVDIAVQQGTMQNGFVALFDASGAEVACSNEFLGLTVNNSSLVPGSWYYLAVDNFVNPVGDIYQGSFSLIVNSL